MHLQSCLRPQKVFNNYIGDYIYIPCGKCEACLNVKRQQQVDKLTEEQRKWSYSHFFTLTYTEEKCPKIHIHSDGDPVTLFSADCRSVGSELYQVTYDLTEEIVKKDWNDYDIEFVANKEFIRIGSKTDIRNFIKRFRNYVKENFKNTPFSYYVVLEYSPEKKRPHYHGILFHSCPELAQEMRKVLDSTWKNGRTNVTLAGQRALGYVAKYVNSYTYLPKIYDYSEWKPFVSYSRRKAFGSPQSYSDESREIVNGAVNYFSRVVNGKAKTITFSRSFEDRLFPKCKEFNNLSFAGRVSVYRKAEYILELAKTIGCSDLEAYNTYINFRADESDFEPNFSLSDFYISRKVIYLSDFYNMTVEQYVQRICDYYDWKEKEALHRFYEFQEEYVADFPNEVGYLISMYPKAFDFLRNVLGSASDTMSLDKYIDELRNRGFPDVDICCLDYHNSAEYKEFSALHIKISKDSSKTKVLNEHYINF